MPPPLRQRAVQAALRWRSVARDYARRESAALKRRSPLHEWLGGLHRFSQRHPVGANEWDAEYAESDYTERLDTITHVAHHAVIQGYLTYGAKEPAIIDLGCGHGRLLRLLTGLGFSDYLGVDWSAQGIAHARSLSIPRTRFEVADMNSWDTTERFDAVVLNNSLYYCKDPRAVFQRTLGWLADGGLVLTAMYRGLGSRYVWSLIESAPVEQVAGCAVKDDATGAVWDVKALRPLPVTRTI